jgi:hypothetical protein
MTDQPQHRRVLGWKSDARPLASHEAAIIGWLLANGERLECHSHTVNALRVVGCCGCGCASIEFEPNGYLGDARVLAGGTGVAADGSSVEVILWGRPDALTALEVVEFQPEATGSLPTLASLRRWDEPEA